MSFYFVQLRLVESSIAYAVAGSDQPGWAGLPKLVPKKSLLQPYMLRRNKKHEYYRTHPIPEKETPLYYRTHPIPKKETTLYYRTHPIPEEETSLYYRTQPIPEEETSLYYRTHPIPE